MPKLKRSARIIHTALQVAASFIETSCASLWNTPRSIANMASTKTLKPIHNQSVFNILPPALRKITYLIVYLSGLALAIPMRAIWELQKNYLLLIWLDGVLTF